MSLLAPAEAFLREDEWEFERAPDGVTLRVPIEGRNGRWGCLVQALADGERLLVYGVVQARVPEGRRAEMADFLTRANSGLPLGNFEMDHADGEVRFKTSIDVAGGELTPALFRNLFYSNAAAMDRYLPGITAVAAGASGMAAIASIEG